MPTGRTEGRVEIEVGKGWGRGECKEVGQEEMGERKKGVAKGKG